MKDLEEKLVQDPGQDVALPFNLNLFDPEKCLVQALPHPPIYSLYCRLPLEDGTCPLAKGIVGRVRVVLNVKLVRVNHQGLHSPGEADLGPTVQEHSHNDWEVGVPGEPPD